jgi:isopenicillin-N epimerase
MLQEWMLDPTITYLNHGTVGAPPRRVLEAQQAIRDEIERQPSRALFRDISGLIGGPKPEPTRLRLAAASVAAFLGGEGRDVVFVENATSGLNAVLRSFELAEGDELLVTDHTYGAIVNAVTFAAGRRGARVRTVRLPYPVPNRQALADAVVDGLSERSRLVVVDHISAESAIVMPVAEIAARCRARGVAVLVDGAHAPGSLPVDIPALGVDWYAGNLHKWAYAPRSCGFLWAARDRQADLHPTVISWGLGQGFTAEFDWVGTSDPSASLAAPHGIHFIEELGVDKVRRYNHDLAWAAGRLLASALGTDVGVDESMTASMITVPLPERAGATQADAWRLRDALLYEDRIEVQLHSWRSRLWLRVSAQIYNELADVARLVAALAARL